MQRTPGINVGGGFSQFWPVFTRPPNPYCFREIEKKFVLQISFTLESAPSICIVERVCRTREEKESTPFLS